MKTKKLLSLILAILTLALCIAPIAASAEDKPLYQHTIFDLCNDIILVGDLQSNGRGFYPYVYEGGFAASVVEKDKVIKYKGRDYYKLNELIDTMEKIKVVIYNNYTGKLADCIFNLFKNEKFFIERDGYVYSSGKLPTNYRYIYPSDDGLYWFCYGSYDGSTTAEMIVTKVKEGEKYSFGTSNDYADDIYCTVRLVRSDEKGYRICGGTAYEYLVPGYVDDNPATGEDTSDIIVFAILGAVSLAAVTVMVKKKRT